MPNQKRQTEFVSVEKSHGRIENRTIKVSTLPAAYLGWNGVKQIFEIERQRDIRGKVTIETVYGITSLLEDLAPPKQLLHFVRRHWAIENELHNVRDITFDEDRCRVRNHRKAQILAAIRSVAITILRRAGFTNITEGREWCSEDRKRALYPLLGRTE